MADPYETTRGAGAAVTREELERRLEAVASDLARGLGDTDGDTDPDDTRPRWIDPAELVRRMRPYICDN